MPSSLFQLRDLGVSVLIGVFGGWLYGSYRLFFRLLNWRTRLLTAIGDTVYWAVFTGITCVFVFLETPGEVRFYTFLGIGFGFFCYRKFFHARIAAVGSRHTLAFFRYFGYLKQTLLWPLWPFRFLIRFVDRYRPH